MLASVGIMWYACDNVMYMLATGVADAKTSQNILRRIEKISQSVLWYLASENVSINLNYLISIFVNRIMFRKISLDLKLYKFRSNSFTNGIFRYFFTEIKKITKDLKKNKFTIKTFFCAIIPTRIPGNWSKLEIWFSCYCSSKQQWEYFSLKNYCC